MMCLSARLREGGRTQLEEKWEEGGRGTEEGLETPPQGARQPSSGWALWYILPIFHAHPSWCDPTQGPLYPWQASAGKHAAALIAWNLEQRPPRRGEGGHWGTLCFSPALLRTQTDVRPTPALSFSPKEEVTFRGMGLKDLVLGVREDNKPSHSKKQQQYGCHR